MGEGGGEFLSLPQFARESLDGIADGAVLDDAVCDGDGVEQMDSAPQKNRHRSAESCDVGEEHEPPDDGESQHGFVPISANGSVWLADLADKDNQDYIWKIVVSLVSAEE